MDGAADGAQQAQQQGQQGMPQQPSGSQGGNGAGPELIDRLVKQRMEQAFGAVFGRLLESSEKAAKAAESNAAHQRGETWQKG